LKYEIAIIDNAWGTPGTSDGHAIGAYKIGNEYFKIADSILTAIINAA